MINGNREMFHRYNLSVQKGERPVTYKVERDEASMCIIGAKPCSQVDLKHYEVVGLTTLSPVGVWL